MESLLLLIFSSLILTARAASNESDLVLDLDGNGLRRGQLYYAVSVTTPFGGLRLVSPNGSSCPLNVALASEDELIGRHMAFFPEDPDNDIVQHGATLYVMFPEPTECSESTMWKVDTAGMVTTGGTSSSTIGTHDSRFVFRKVEDGGGSPLNYYNVEVCPCSIGVSRPSCKMGCYGPLGLVQQGDNYLIGINEDRPLKLLFLKPTERVAGVVTSLRR